MGEFAMLSKSRRTFSAEASFWWNLKGWLGINQMYLFIWDVRSDDSFEFELNDSSFMWDQVGKKESVL